MSDKPENPWKKRRKWPREFMPPSRALLADFGASSTVARATATWCFYRTAVPNVGMWKCTSASIGLKWMVGSTNPMAVRKTMTENKINWHWIEPNTVRVLAPPF